MAERKSGAAAVVLVGAGCDNCMTLEAGNMVIAVVGRVVANVAGEWWPSECVDQNKRLKEL